MKLTHQSGLMALVAILSGLSGCSVEIFDEILLYLCFIIQNSCSQVDVLQESNDTNKA
ncbi:hypothetical protein [Providencia alcalifaciens]|uniref:hypothetical protein n=1 Tax=Providencia alcalifaciens TaxID=126385 RepID=UPI0032DA6843